MAPLDAYETPNGYEVDVALPGVRAEDIELTVDANTLTIVALVYRPFRLLTVQVVECAKGLFLSNGVQ